MKSRCRSSGAALIFRVDCLIPVSVTEFVCNIRRKRHLAESVQDFFEDSLVLKLHQSVPLIENVEDHSLQAPVAESYPGSRFQFLSRPYKCLPPVGTKSFQQQDLGVCSRVFLCAQEPCGDHFSIVEDQCVSGP